MDVVLPLTLGEALEAMAERADPRPIAGGTDAHNGQERLGAGVTYARIEADADPDDALLQAARVVGSPQVRAQGTVGGEHRHGLTRR